MFFWKKNARSVKRRCPPLMGWFINPINYNYNNRKPTYAKFNQIPLIKSHLLHRGQPSLFRCFKCRARSLALDKQWDISARWGSWPKPKPWENHRKTIGTCDFNQQKIRILLVFWLIYPSLVNLVNSGVCVTWLLVGLSTNLSSPIIIISIVVGIAMNGDTWYNGIFVFICANGEVLECILWKLMGPWWKVVNMKLNLCIVNLWGTFKSNFKHAQRNMSSTPRAILRQVFDFGSYSTASRTSPSCPRSCVCWFVGLYTHEYCSCPLVI